MRIKTEQSKVWEGKTNRTFYIVNTTLLILFLVIELYPLIYIVACSFSSGDALVSGKVKLLPVDFTLDGYAAVFEYKSMWTGFRNSILYTVSGTLIGVTLTILAAYPLSRPDLRGRKAIMSLFLFTMMFNGGLIPTYLLIKNLNMLDTIWAVILPTTLTAYHVIVARTFFTQNIPIELLEAAQMDGCTDFGFFRRIAIPLSMPILAVLTLWVAIALWNGYFTPMIYLSSDEKMPLQLVLRRILLLSQVDVSEAMADPERYARNKYMSEILKYGMIVISSLPLMLVYPFAQKYFVQGVMIGSVKG